MHAVDLAGLLMELGQTDAAARELSAAAALDPDLPALWLTRARLLSSDAHGRTLGVELDREALLASARRALELAPADPAAHEAVAWALLRSSTGRPLGVGSEPEAAALHMRSLILDDHYELGDLYIRTELVAGDRARLEATLDGLQGASVDAARVTLRALRDGPEAAVRMLDQDVSADEVGAVAGVIAQHLTACGEFTLAADLVTELARVRGTPPPDPRWIGFMRAVGEAELAAPAPDSAEWLAYTLMNGMAVGASPAREHLTRAARRDPAVMALVRSTSAPALNLDATPALTERLVAVATADVAGDDRIGHRVVWKTGLSDGSVNRITFYTVKERGEHRLLGISPAVDPVVEHALGLAERGEMDGARQVLRWLADEGSRLGARVRAGLAAAGESDDDLMWAVWMAAASVDQSSTAVDRLAEGLPGIDRPALAIAVAEALDDALRRRGDLTGALLAASGLRERFAEHEEAQHLWGIAAARVGDPSFEAWLAQQRASAGDEVVYALMEASWRSARGDVAGVLELLRARVESSGARLELMNHLVWAEVMAGEPSAHDVGVLGAFVQRAVDAGGSPLAYAGALHTLATAQVELGLHREALAGMRQAIAGGVLDPDELGEWGLVAGGLAAAAGDDARARALWQTAAGDPEAEVRALAQRFAAELSP